MLLYIYRSPLSLIICGMLALIPFYGMLAFISQKNLILKKVWRIVNFILFAVTLYLVLKSTILRGYQGVRGLLLKPFYTFEIAKTEIEIYRSQLMNIFMFFPFGLSFPHILPKAIKTRNIFLILFSLSAVLSTIIEILQYAFYMGQTQTDDVICNVMGACFGALHIFIYKYSNKIFENTIND